MVFDRRTAESDAVLRLQHTGGFGDLRAGVFDGLGFVEHDVIELDVFQDQHIAAERAVGRQNQMVLLEFGPQLGPFEPGVLEDFHVRRELLGFLLPVEQQRLGDDDQRRPLFLGPFSPGFQESQHLDRFAETHVVREAAAEPEVFKELQPADAFALVRPEFALERGGLLDLLNAFEIPQPLAGVGELCIVVDGRLS